MFGIFRGHSAIDKKLENYSAQFDIDAGNQQRVGIILTLWPSLLHVRKSRVSREAEGFEWKASRWAIEEKHHEMDSLVDEFLALFHFQAYMTPRKSVYSSGNDTIGPGEWVHKNPSNISSPNIFKAS